MQHAWEHVMVSSSGIFCTDFRPSLLTVHWSSVRVTLSVYCTVILHVCCSTQIRLCASRTTTNNIRFALDMRSEQPFGSCVVVCSPLLREDFVQLQAAEPLSSGEDVTILQLKYKHIVAMATAPLYSTTHTATHPHARTHTHTHTKQQQQKVE